MRSLALLLLAACTADPTDVDDTDDTDDTEVDDTDDTDTDTPDLSWRDVAADLPGSLLSITGTTFDDVWTVGAQGQAFHWDGAAWSTLDTDGEGDLWWVWRGADDVAWFAGAGGRVVRHDRATGVSEAEVLDADLTFFGIWGTSEADLWAVGGNIALSANGASIWHRVGTTWAEVDLPTNAASKLAMYKIWGTAADNVWICGLGGALAQWDGDAWSDVASPTTRDLFTIHGSGPSEIYAVGGIASAAIVAWNGTAWTDESPDFGPQFNGVFVGSEGPVAAGKTGEIWQRDGAGTWTRDGRGIASFKDFHATWTDPDGGIWAVGGKLSSNTEGTLVYGGPGAVTALAP